MHYVCLCPCHNYYILYSYLHADVFRLVVGFDDAERCTFIDTAESILKNTDIIETILTCTEAYVSNKIKISIIGVGSLKVYEIKIMGMM